MRKIDLMCSSYRRATENRRMVKLKQNISGYIQIEIMVKNWPRKKPLPSWLWGYIPSADKSEERELREYGVYEIDNKRENHYNGGINE